MLLRTIIYVILFFILFLKDSAQVSFSNLLSGVLGSVLSGYHHTTCMAGYCCNPTYIPADIEGLEAELKKKLYGQQIAIDTVIHALNDHWRKNVSQKALTLSFHGPPGAGKNYVSNFIKKHLFRTERYIHLFNGRIHFPKASKIEEYQDNLRIWLQGNISDCDRQLFVFDEVDKIIPGLLDVIKPFIDYNVFVDRKDYRQAIFIFISNTGSGKIIEETLKLWNKGFKRSDLNLHHFEKLILEGAFNEKGGFQFSDTIKSNLIDHYIPFLPLEEEHVKQCIIDEFEKRGVQYPQEKHIKQILDGVEWGPTFPEDSSLNIKQYSTTGCKSISQKVGLYASKYYYINSRSEL